MWSKSKTRFGIRIGYTTEWIYQIPSKLRNALPWSPDFVRAKFIDVPTTLPLAPIWPGFLANTIFYALAWMGVFWAARRINIGVLRPTRRKRRLRRGRCPNCGYPFGDLPRCPECGDPLTRRGDEPNAPAPA